MSTELEQKLITALREIARDERAFRGDRLLHASDCVDSMKQIANDALLDVAAAVATEDLKP